MMKKLLLLISLLLSSCADLPVPPESARLAEDQQLLMPIYGGTEKQNLTLENSLINHLSSNGKRVINSNQLPQLSPYSREDDIVPGGNFNTKEIANCGHITKAGVLYSVFIEQIHSYPPQQISLRINRLHFHDKNFKRYRSTQAFLYIDLNNRGEKIRFQKFIDGQPQKESSLSHTAALSPKIFLNYVAHRIAQEFKIIEKKL